MLMWSFEAPCALGGADLQQGPEEFIVFRFGRCSVSGWLLTNMYIYRLKQLPIWIWGHISGI